MKRTKVVKEIPAGSVLSTLQRKGVEGTCIACGKAIHEHYGHRNTWMGCQAKGLEVDTPFLLVPARRRVDSRKVMGQVQQAANGVAVSQPGASRLPLRRRVGSPRGQGPVIYVADGRVNPQKLDSPRLQQVFEAIAEKHKAGIKRRELLRALRVSKRPGVIDGSVRRLVQAGIVKRIVDLPEGL